MAVFSLYVVTNFLLKDHKLCLFVQFVFVVSVSQKLPLLCLFALIHIWLLPVGSCQQMLTSNCLKHI
jgi:hypothetical protein